MKTLPLLIVALLAQVPAPSAPTNVRLTLGAPTGPSYGPQASIACPSGAVPVGTAQSLQTAVSANPAGTTFCILAGVHPVLGSIVPKSGDTFIGEYGAVLDGTGWATTDLDDAVFRSVNNGVINVTIRNIVLRNGPEYGVNAYLTAANWRVENCEIYGFRNGISLGKAGVVARNWIHHNVGIFNSPNPSLRGGGYTFNSSDGASLIDNDISYNGQEQKFIYGTLNEPSQHYTITGNFVHNNLGDGLWIDGDGFGSKIENNTVEYNGRTGITIEISSNVLVRTNACRRNGAEGILISATRDSIVSGNTLEGNLFGIGLFLDFSRLAETYAFWTVDLAGNTIIGNTVQVPAVGGAFAALLTFVGQGNQTPYLSNTKNNIFTGNRYVVPTLTGSWFVWNGNKTFAQWQALGMDADGTVQ